MAKSVNKVILVGNVGKDPEVKYTPSGTALAKFRIATNERFKDKSGEWQDPHGVAQHFGVGAPSRDCRGICPQGLQDLHRGQTANLELGRSPERRKEVPHGDSGPRPLTAWLA